MNPQATRNSTELLEGQNCVLELIAQGCPLPEILDALLSVIQVQSPGLLCSILLLDPDGIHVRHCATRDLPEAFIRGVDGEPIGPQAGSCGTAAFRGEPVVVEDIATDPLWDRYRELALGQGLRACWSTPIFDSSRKVLGTFAMYFRAPGRPEAQHLRLIGIATHIAAIAINSHKRAEALRASEERLRLALSGGNVDIWEYDVSASRLRWHGQLNMVLSSSPGTDDLTLTSFLEAIHPGDRHNVQALFLDAAAWATDRKFDFRVDFPDGSVHWFESQGRAECDSSGQILRMRGVAVEVTEQRRAAEEILRREMQLVEAQRIARLGSYEWDLRTNAVRRSQELYRIFGLPPHEFEPTYEGYLSRVHPEDRMKTKEIVDQAFAQGKPFDFEERIVRPDGSIRILHSQGHWGFDDRQRPIKLVGICQDITERKQAERQLLASNAALAAELRERSRAETEIQALSARLINAQEEERARLARELHDDLSQQIAILGIAAGNLKKIIAPEDTRARAESEHIQSKLTRLTESVRKISHGLHPAMLEYSGLGVALQSYCSEFGTLTGTTVSFRAEGSFERLPSAVALCLYRIAQEALQNVFKHAQVGQARLTVTVSSESVSLTVSDRGVGIDTDRSSIRQGLGLVSIKERARLVNGSVTIESRLNEGTTLNVRIPISDGCSSSTS